MFCERLEEARRSRHHLRLPPLLGWQIDCQSQLRRPLVLRIQPDHLRHLPVPQPKASARRRSFIVRDLFSGIPRLSDVLAGMHHRQVVVISRITLVCRKISTCIVVGSRTRPCSRATSCIFTNRRPIESMRLKPCFQWKSLQWVLFPRLHALDLPY